MKIIGLIGGMSWESTVTYYKIINETVKRQLGGLHSAKCLLYSVDFDEIEQYQSRGEWGKSGEVLADAAVRLEQAGADFIVICTNTMHKVAPAVQSKISIPLVHIAEATADELEKHRIAKVALLGTKYTMTQDFYKAKLIDRGIEVLVPEENEIETVNSIIYDELCLGIISEKSRAEYVRIVKKLSQRGAQGVILGCTEIGLLLRQSDTETPLFDTTVIHATKAAMLSAEG
ncbi:MAG: aspartate/glutamate racemase family protein [Clostridiales bacterium]|nr:aspartate/glutamate racemase family protein [Clostridiales bacterium]